MEQQPDNKNIRWLNLVAKLGSEDAARAEMRRRGASSRRNLGGKGGFYAMKRDNPALHKAITSKGGRNNHAQKDSAHRQDAA